MGTVLYLTETVPVSELLVTPTTSSLFELLPMVWFQANGLESAPSLFPDALSYNTPAIELELFEELLELLELEDLELLELLELEDLELLELDDLELELEELLELLELEELLEELDEREELLEELDEREELLELLDELELDINSSKTTSSTDIGISKSNGKLKVNGISDPYWNLLTHYPFTMVQ